MNPTELINDLLKRSDGSLDQLKLHYGPLIRYVIAPILPDARDREEVLPLEMAFEQFREKLDCRLMVELAF